MKQYQNKEEYIADFPEETQKLLREIHAIIKRAAPMAEEKIAYGIPTFTLHGNLVHFGGAKSHIGFYPGSKPIEAFAKELEGYKTSKGTIQFPIAKPLPAGLITKIVKFCIERNTEKTTKKNKKTA